MAERQWYRVWLEHAINRNNYIVLAHDFGEAARGALLRDTCYAGPADALSTKVIRVELYGDADAVIQ